MTPNLVASSTAMRDPRDPTIHRAMLALAEALLTGRERYRDGQVELGVELRPAIEDGIRRARALVRQWRWVTTPALGPLPEPEWPIGWWGAWQPELADDALRAAVRARNRAEAGDAEAVNLAGRCDVLAWYQHLDGPYLSRIVNMIDLDRYCAARLVDQQREAA